MNYTLKDGGTISASTPQEFVTRLRESSRFDNNCPDEQYMQNFAARFKTQEGRDININSPELFLNALLESGFAKKEE